MELNGFSFSENLEAFSAIRGIMRIHVTSFRDKPKHEKYQKMAESAFRMNRRVRIIFSRQTFYRYALSSEISANFNFRSGFQ